MKQREGSRATDFFDRAKTSLGSVIKIDRMANAVRNGTADYFVTYRSYIIAIEVKAYSETGNYVTEHHFSSLQMRDLRQRMKAGGLGIGLILKSKKELPEAKFILADQIPEDGKISKSLFDTMEEFSWERIYELAKLHSRRFEGE